jgi:hypothetical protein
VRKYARQVLGLDVFISPLLWPAPDISHVLSFNLGDSLQDRPNPHSLAIDWFWPGESAWTNDTATLFARKFCGLHRSGAFPEIKGSLKYSEVANAFIKYVLRMKMHYSRTLHESGQDDDSTSSEIGSQM